MVGAAIGLGVGSLYQGIQEGKKADKANDRSLALGQQQMDFQQEQLDNWESMFGGIEQNLTDYYSNLDPTKFATQGKENLNVQMDKQLSQLNESMSAQGIQTSGMRAQAEKEAAFGKATGAAAIDLTSEDYVAQQQAGYLGTKEPRRSGAVSGVGNAYGNQQTQYANQAQQYGKSQAGYFQGAGNMFGSALSLGINSGGSQGSGYSPGTQGPVRPDGAL